MLKTATVALTMIGVCGLAFGAWGFLVAARSVAEGTASLVIALIGVTALGGAVVTAAVLRLTDHVERAAAEAAIARRDQRSGG